MKVYTVWVKDESDSPIRACLVTNELTEAHTESDYWIDSMDAFDSYIRDQDGSIIDG